VSDKAKPQIVVYALDDARAALRAAAEHDFDITLVSPAGAAAYDGTVQSNSVEGLHKAALAGLGITQLRSFAVWQDVQVGRLQHILPDHIVDDLPISVAYAHRRHLSPRIRSFVDFLVERYAPPTYRDIPFGGVA
jgi:DNA-binding transcriptional LysR family regulator